MADSEKENLVGGGNEGAAKRWDVLLIVFVTLCKLGDSIELYLPGVITQEISCDLKLTNVKEGLLTVALYLTTGLSTMVGFGVVRVVGLRITLLISLYLSVGATILSVTQVTYPILIITRLLVGVCVGFNIVVSGLFISKNAIRKKSYEIGTMLSSLTIDSGGGWMGLLAYFFLKPLGWKSFTLITSLPLFAVCIILLQFFLKEDNMPAAPWHEPRRDSDASTEGSIGTTNTEGGVEGGDGGGTGEYWQQFRAILPQFLKILVISAVTEYQGMGLSVLLPNMLRAYNGQLIPGTDTCNSRMFGDQFLVYSVVMGGTNLLGKAVGYYLYKTMATGHVIRVCSALFTLSYTLLLYFKDTLIVVDVIAGLIRFLYSLNALIMMLVTYDPDVFGKATLLLASSLLIGSENLATVVSIVCDEAFSNATVIGICVAVSVAQLVAATLLKEV